LFLINKVSGRLKTSSKRAATGVRERVA